ncbi:MAG: polysaccharide deacetylase [Methylomonas sp.]|nr:MAG: polysaccharide deacetylase [Methylomonas sp.]
MIETFLLSLLQPFATLASGIGNQKKLLIMIYHRVLDEPDFMRPGEVDKAAFTWQMQLLAKHFNVLPLAEALERMQNNTLPPRAVCITFDDGYADNYTNALPILQRFDLKATFFIASGFLDGGRMWNDTVIEAVRNITTASLDLNKAGLGVFETSTHSQKCQSAQEIIKKIKHLDLSERTRYVEVIAAKSQDLPNDLMLTSEQLKELHQSGMEIGGHTVNHPILAKLDETTSKREIKENKIFLEELLGVTLQFFAYPNGKPEIDYLRQHAEWVKQAGFSAAVSTQWGVATKDSSLMELPRFTPWDGEPLKFMLRIIMLSAKF